MSTDDKTETTDDKATNEKGSSLDRLVGGLDECEHGVGKCLPCSDCIQNHIDESENYEDLKSPQQERNTMPKPETETQPNIDEHAETTGADPKHLKPDPKCFPASSELVGGQCCDIIDEMRAWHDDLIDQSRIKFMEARDAKLTAEMHEKMAFTLKSKARMNGVDVSEWKTFSTR